MKKRVIVIHHTDQYRVENLMVIIDANPLNGMVKAYCFHPASDDYMIIKQFPCDDLHMCNKHPEAP